MRITTPSPSMVVALGALVFATGGTALAARTYVITSSSQIRNDAITGADVRNSSLTGRDLQNKSVTGADVKDGSLTARDFRGGGLSGASSALGPQGPQGPVGPIGPKGESADANVIGVSEYDDTPPKLTSASDTTLLTLSLPAGANVVTAKVTLENTGSAAVLVDCFLRRGNGEDESRATLQGATDARSVTTMTLPFTLGTVVSAGEDSVVRLSCNGFGVPVTTTDAKITSVRVPIYAFTSY